jgi:hypothetical protein
VNSIVPDSYMLSELSPFRFTIMANIKVGLCRVVTIFGICLYLLTLFIICWLLFFIPLWLWVSVTVILGVISSIYVIYSRLIFDSSTELALYHSSVSGAHIIIGNMEGLQDVELLHKKEKHVEELLQEQKQIIRHLQTQIFVIISKLEKEVLSNKDVISNEYLKQMVIDLEELRSVTLRLIYELENLRNR